MKIFLSKPGGHQEGPYTLEQINHDLAAKKYRDTDYWAWHEGLKEWVPLHRVPGILGSQAAAVPAPKPQPVVAPKPPAPEPAKPAMAAPPAPPATREPRPTVSSGMPASALELVLLLATGDGPTAFESPTTARLLREVIGEDFAQLPAIPRDVIGRCGFVEQLKRDGTIPEQAWRAMSAVRPAVVQEARTGGHKICVRTFPLEANETVAVFLFYNKQKLGGASPAA
jgi:hypothetical protein